MPSTPSVGADHVDQIVLWLSPLIWKVCTFAMHLLCTDTPPSHGTTSVSKETF